MGRYRTYCLFVGLGIIAGMIPAAIASRGGADPAFNGGIAALAATCSSCHAYNQGPGGVELLGLPRRYRSGEVYGLSVRVSDPQQVGAGFQISAETTAGHQGALLRSDTLNTQFSPGGGTDFLTHTSDGVDDSIDNWLPSGSYTYNLGWQAPANDVGPITFFVAGNAVNDANSFFGDRYYATDATIPFAIPGDADGDTDIDLSDYVAFQNCFLGNPFPAGCEYVDMDDDAVIGAEDISPWNAARTGPTATLPADYVLADAIRGGKLYQHWWLATGSPEPTGDHPLYPPAGSQSGSVTFECNECHGWDYEGVSGQYASGPHFTGIGGVLGTTKTPRQIFELLKADPAVTPGGHNMDAYGMTDRDVWDVTKMALEGTVDTGGFTSGGLFTGDFTNGSILYSIACGQCHGEDGTAFSFSHHGAEFVGTVAVQDPWHFLHVTRFGHPGAPMPATESLHWTVQDAADIGVFSQTLPTE